MLEPMLKTWDIPYKIVSSEETCHRVSECYKQAETEGRTVAVLERGRVVQRGELPSLVSSPATTFTARLLGGCRPGPD